MLKFSVSWLLFACASTVAHAQTTERFSVVANNETVGHLLAVHSGNDVDIEYEVRNNGRGPAHKEHLTLGSAGIPLDWSISGTSEMGGNVAETMAWKDGNQSWTSQADHGSVHVASPHLYIGNDASPWSFGLYARILKALPGGSLDVLPSGALKLQKVRHLKFGDAGRQVELDAYVLSGVQLTPELVLLDQDGSLFAVLSDSVLVREGYEKQYNGLRDLNETLTLEVLESIQKKIAHVYDYPIRIRNVRLYDPKSQTTGPLTSLVIYRGMITSTEPQRAGTASLTDEVVFDGEGGTAVSGLHDMHSHNSLWSGLFYLAAGVTTTRDMGNINEFLLDLTKRLDAGQIPGPHIIPSGFLEGRSPYSARMGFIPETLDAGLEDVRWYADRGYLQIKIYNSMNPDWVKPLAAQAHEAGMRVVGHVPAFMTPDRAIEDGYDEITHINQLMLGWLLEPGEDTRTPLRLTAMARAADLDLGSPRVRHTIELMKAHHTGLDTTATTLERLMMSRAGEVQEGGRAVSRPRSYRLPAAP